MQNIYTDEIEQQEPSMFSWYSQPTQLSPLRNILTTDNG